MDGIAAKARQRASRTAVAARWWSCTVLLLGGAVATASSGAAERHWDPLPLNTAAQSCAHLAERLASVSLQQCMATDFGLAETASVRGRALLVRDYEPALPSADSHQDNGSSGQSASEPIRVLLFGGIHGDELSSVSVIFRFLERLEDEDHDRIHWRVVPVLNPDGLLRRPATRVNARGVDLNRNFPSPDWERSALPYWNRRTGSDPRRYPGPGALSEPESGWLASQIRQFSPHVIVAMHAPLGLLDFDGVGAEPPSRLGFLRLQRLGTYPGSLGDWAGRSLGIPVFTPELPYAGIMPTTAQIDELWRDLGRWIIDNVSPHAAVPDTGLLPTMQWMPD